MTKYRLTFETRGDDDATEAVERIADAMADGSESGTVADDADGLIAWRLDELGQGLEIDRRQRLAAAALLMGFDLPQEMRAASHTMMEAAGVCPGMTTGDLAPMGPQGRHDALMFAKRLIDEMLDENPKVD